MIYDEFVKLCLQSINIYLSIYLLYSLDTCCCCFVLAVLSGGVRATLTRLRCRWSPLWVMTDTCTLKRVSATRRGKIRCRLLVSSVSTCFCGPETRNHCVVLQKHRQMIEEVNDVMDGWFSDLENAFGMVGY